jgi:hypothetical protein
VFLRDGRLDGELLFLPGASLADKLHQIVERMSALDD